MIYNVVERRTRATGALPFKMRLAHSSPELAVLCDLATRPSGILSPAVLLLSDAATLG